MSLKEKLSRFARRLNERGQEIPDPTPVAPPVGFVRQKSLAEQIREMVRSERLRQEVEAQGYETFEEADDFDVDEDDPLPFTPYQVPEAPYDPQFGPANALDTKGRSEPDRPDGAEAAIERQESGQPQAEAE